MRKFIFVLLLVLPGVVCSCQIFAHDEKVTFELPQWPDYLPELMGWEIGCSGVVELVETPPDKRHVAFHLTKNQSVCITATPITEVPFFKPAGTIYPYSQKITWSGGYAVQIFNTIPERGQFNWEKLLEALENCENPWLLDSQEVLEGIAYHNFTANKLKLSGALSIPLDFMVYSSYVPENQIIQETGAVTVIKNQPEMFAVGGEFAIIISASSAKNISLDLISMPIFKEDL